LYLLGRRDDIACLCTTLEGMLMLEVMISLNFIR